MEANKFSWQTTAHKCNAPSDVGYYDWCDPAGGDMMDRMPDYGYGPADGMIDTRRKFHVKTEFNGPDKFYGYTQTFTQISNSVQNVADSGYSQTLTDSENGHMAYAFSNWGTGEAEWLDHGRC